MRLGTGGVAESRPLRTRVRALRERADTGRGQWRGPGDGQLRGRRGRRGRRGPGGRRDGRQRATAVLLLPVLAQRRGLQPGAELPPRPGRLQNSHLPRRHRPTRPDDLTADAIASEVPLSTDPPWAPSPAAWVPSSPPAHPDLFCPVCLSPPPRVTCHSPLSPPHLGSAPWNFFLPIQEAGVRSCISCPCS
ncbi:glycosylphosphatidylinositol-anchored high density lipoprotein-binding protein 1 isoform X3 [Rousettus aegyptiacus]|uniref:glycosylphosphatidylinositol-anchored high density lipoprotein-binding protein 1 isoform X3 n=1 Tax=Rousettus aegyptiacus TaxID=9407 RepID=UPI00168D5C84|nr:glycosylphosphatidylinositol-anchored high density lipoprotein-binding protein 1 isoform X3 [Rousettus aegyptiacus]XP_036089018.1 glycosylphosphatidylinositol-anchored high density lipoprotein-binding protein 1 isoform X3 [Rousettus aegyptiacus]XP_036089019.1 glycosylphosphatidylinositol-anchored high density lipoprotein-binding protein 1 isoform X3 [Rousettus aegyptiacus]